MASNPCDRERLVFVNFDMHLVYGQISRIVN